MGKLEAILQGSCKSGVYLLDEDSDSSSIRRMVQAAEWCFLYLDGNAISNADEFFDKFGMMIGYPDFGNNWERFRDVLSDLEVWAHCPDKVKGYVILYDNFRYWQEESEAFNEYSLEEVTRFVNNQLGGARVLGFEPSGKPILKSFGEYLLIRGQTNKITWLPELDCK